MLQKTMVVVEGVARSLDPRLDIWKTSEPVVREWIVDNLGPKGRLEEAGRSLAALATRATQLPEVLERAERLVSDLETMNRKGVALAPDSVEAIGRAEARRSRWGNAALWVIAGLLAVIATRLF